MVKGDHQQNQVIDKCNHRRRNRNEGAGGVIPS